MKSSYSADEQSNGPEPTGSLSEAIEHQERLVREQRLARLRLIAEACGMAIIIALVVLFVLNRPQPCECTECPDSTLLTNAFDQAWRQTWASGVQPQPDVVTGDAMCWRVAAFDFPPSGKEQYRATRCIDTADATQVMWHWALWVSGE